MGFRFRKSIKIGKNTRINLSKSGIGLSSGVKGARVSVNQKGTRTTLSAPGTGMSHVSYKSHGSKKQNSKENNTVSSTQESIELTPKAQVYWKFLVPLSAVVALGMLASGVIPGVIGIGITYLIYKKVSSDENKAYRLYNQSLKEKDDTEKIKILEEAREIDDSNDLVNNALAVIHFNNHDTDNAIEAIRKIKDYRKLNINAVASIYLSSLHESERYKEIIEEFEPMMEDDLVIKQAVALSYKELGQVKKASEIFATGPVRKRTYDDIVLSYKYHLGLCYLELGDKQKALTQLEKVYEVDSSFEDITSIAQELGFAVGEHDI